MTAQDHSLQALPTLLLNASTDGELTTSSSRLTAVWAASEKSFVQGELFSSDVSPQSFQATGTSFPKCTSNYPNL